jgi:siroheme synthase-like protein
MAPSTDRPVDLPLQLRVRGRRCLVVGAGPVGTRRAATLAAAGAEVVLVAPEPCADAEQLARDGLVELRRRSVLDHDVQGCLLVVTATGVRDVDASIARAAVASGALVNRADGGAGGDVELPAVVRRGPVQVAVSTGGAAPGLARELARRLDDALGAVTGLDDAGVALLVDLVAELRTELGAGTGRRGDERRGDEQGVTLSSLDWRAVLDGSILDLIHQGRRAEAKERLLACLSSS